MNMYTRLLSLLIYYKICLQKSICIQFFILYITELKYNYNYVITIIFDCTGIKKTLNFISIFILINIPS